MSSKGYTIINLKVPNKESSDFIKQKLIKPKQDIKNLIITGSFKFPALND